MAGALDIVALERTAKDAAEHLPGEWRINTDEDQPSAVAFLDRHAGEERWVAFAHCSGGCLEWVCASEHIATFDPATVLRLLEERRALVDALKIAKRELWETARATWTLADFKNWAVVQQIDRALTSADGQLRASAEAE